jgi:hypothetical protein
VLDDVGGNFGDGQNKRVTPFLLERPRLAQATTAEFQRGMDLIHAFARRGDTEIGYQLIVGRHVSAISYLLSAIGLRSGNSATARASASSA